MNDRFRAEVDAAEIQSGTSEQSRGALVEILGCVV